MAVETSVLVIGIGNPLRGDDGAGIETAAMIERMGLEGVEVRCAPQLVVEDALDVSQRRLVVVIDASVRHTDACTLSTILPAPVVDWTSHAVSPESLAAMCEQLYGVRPDLRLLEIRGYSFELREGLSPAAHDNCVQAAALLRKLLVEPSAKCCTAGASQRHTS